MKAVTFAAGIGTALGAALTAAGVAWRTVDNGLLVSDEALFNSIAGSFDQAAGEKPAKIDEIKAEAAARIESTLPLWKQINLLREGKPNDPLFQKVDAIRVASDSIEAKLVALTDRDAVTGLDVSGAAEWPE